MAVLLATWLMRTQQRRAECPADSQGSRPRQLVTLVEPRQNILGSAAVPAAAVGVMYASELAARNGASERCS